MSTQLESQEFTRQFVAAVSDPRTQKQATDLGQNFIRWRQREDGFMRKFLPPGDVNESELSRVTWTDKSIVVGDIEPDAPAAVSVGYGATPTDFWITPRRYQVTGTMVLSPRVAVLKQQLRNYRYDIRQVFADNIVKDTLYEEDTAGINTINATLLAADTPMYASQVPQWRTISGGITRANVVEGAKVLLKTYNSITPESALCTATTLMDFMKWGRDEVGGDLAEKIVKDGWVQMEGWMGLNWYGTIKRNLIPDGSVYYFAPPKYLGRSILFDPMTMYVDQKYWRYSFFTAHEIGTVIVNTAGVARVDYVGG